MIDQGDIDGKCRHFLGELFDQTKGDSQVQISMYDIGTTMGMDKNTAKQVAEELIGLGMVEIRTLSGGISITEAGIEEVRKFKNDEVSSDAGGPILGNDPGMLSFDQRCLEKYRRWREPASSKPAIV